MINRLLFILFFSFAFIVVEAQNCDISDGILKITALKHQGEFDKGLEFIEELLNCPKITKSDQVIIYILQYKLYRNKLKNKKALLSLQKGTELQQQLNNNLSLDYRLLLAESYALNNRPNKFKELMSKIEAEIYQNQDSISLGRFYYLKQFSVDRQLFSAEHLGYIYKSLEYFKNITPASVYYKGNLLRSLGNGARTNGDFEKSISFYTQELQVWRQFYNPNHFNISICNYNIGNVYYEKLEFEKALDHYLKAYEIWKTVFKPEGRRMRILNEAIGDMYWELKNYEKALEYFNYSIQYEEKINNDSSEITLITADSLLEKGNYDLAINYYEEAVRWRQKTYGEDHMLTGACKNFVARAIRSTGDKEASLKTYQEAIIILVNDFEDNRWISNPTLDMDVKSNQYLLEALIAKGDLLKELFIETKDIQKLTVAWETQELAIQLVEKIKNNQMSKESKLFWTTKTNSLFESAIHTAFLLFNETKDEKYIVQAFNVSERSKALLLLASLYDQEVTAFANIPFKIIEKEQRIKTEINNYIGKIESEEKRCAAVRQKMLKLYNDKLIDLVNEYDVLINTIKQSYPDYYHLKYDIKIPSLEKIRRELLNPSKALVSYFLGKKLSFVFYVTSNSISIRKIENTDILNHQIQSYFNLLSATNENEINYKYSNFTELSHQLYQQLLKEELHGFFPKQLMIIPDGNLAYIPFETLITDSINNNRVQYRQLPYLLNETAISYVPSASVAIHFYNEVSTTNNYYGFAPDYSDETDNEFRKKQRNLKFNKPEVEFAADLFNGKSWTGPQVTEDLLKEHSKNAGILHLAMHGEVEDNHPLLSKLYFNSSPKEDGLLNIYEVYNLKIPAQLIILSACNTASGILQRGEGILSLERAFQYAGSKSLVATLWSVDDAASSIIIQDFLKNIKEGMSKDIALQQAKISFLNTANPEQLHPFYWSSFKVTGNINPLNDSNFKVYWLIGLGLLLLISAKLFYNKKNKAA